MRTFAPALQAGSYCCCFFSFSPSSLVTSPAPHLPVSRRNLYIFVLNYFTYHQFDIIFLEKHWRKGSKF